MSIAPGKPDVVIVLMLVAPAPMGLGNLACCVFCTTITFGLDTVGTDKTILTLLLNIIKYIMYKIYIYNIIKLSNIKEYTSCLVVKEQCSE